ncbi:MAG: hypothetical protein GTO14_23470 [Anaerolineales bacterium]|nr:hypothetical protein [Anaerolineales bacterium]
MPASPTIPPLPTKTPPPTATPDISPTPVETIDEGHPGLPLPQERGDFFSGSGACTICHAKMSSDTGADVSLDSYWRSTMMANAARDPYWQASLAAEVMENPALQSEIEDQCAKCHMPMGRFTAREKGDEVRVLGEDGFLDPDSTLHDLAMDGVSCSLCHQIRETGLGSSVTYSGDFVIDTELRMPDRLIFGPFTVEDNQADIMQSVSGFRPEQGLHLTGSTFCATCHTLYTPYVDATGQIAGEFPEQVSYFEWFYSDYRRSRPCQDCHMPEAEGGVKIANTSEVLRSPFALHSFVGGNAYMLEILKTFPDELGVTASSEHFDATIERTRRQLGQETAEITLEEVRLSGTFLTVDVDINNLVGHKFPTGFPARRAWIHFAVRDASGQVVFESGAPNPDGSIIGNDNDADPSVFEQHYSAIVQPEQVQIYEAILLNSENRITTTLLEAARYRKDNRLLPSGFEKAAPYEDIAVRGNARDDEDFEGGGDEIRYVVNVGAAQGPFKVTVDLLYQSVGYRWVDNLRSYETPLVNRFIEFYDAVPNLPVVVASASAEVGG